MLILGIESSSVTAGAALVRDGRVIAELTLNDKKTHSQTLLPMIDEIVTLTGVQLSELDAIAVSAGPGSYTGLRIGSATAKGFGLALDRPLVEVSTLEAMAAVCWGYAGLICPVIDARRDQVYTGVWKGAPYEASGAEFTRLSCLMEPALLTLSELEGRLRELFESEGGGLPVMFTGDASLHAAEVLSAAVPVLPAVSTHACPRAASVALVGAAMAGEGLTVKAEDHRPFYLRKTQAERERDAGIYTKGSIIPGEGINNEGAKTVGKGEAGEQC